MENIYYFIQKVQRQQQRKLLTFLLSPQTTRLKAINMLIYNVLLQNTFLNLFKTYIKKSQLRHNCLNKEQSIIKYVHPSRLIFGVDLSLSLSLSPLSCLLVYSRTLMQKVKILHPIVLLILIFPVL